MRKHIFTLGLLLSSFCIMPTMAVYQVPNWAGPTYITDIAGIYDDEGLGTPVTMRCDDCCGAYASNGYGGWVDRGHCWLPQRSDPYWDITGGFLNSCTNEPTVAPRQPCISDVTYSEISGKCVANCGTGKYDLGRMACAPASENGTSSSYSGVPNQTWSVNFAWAGGSTVSGKAACYTGSYTFNTPVGTIYSGNLTGGTTEGIWCFCRMTSPSTINPKWVAAKFIGNGTACVGSCASDCANAVQTNSTVRAALFSTYAM